MDKYDALTRYSLANRKLNNLKVVRIDRPPVRRTSNGRPDGQLDRSWVRNVSPFGLDQVEFHQATNRTFDPYMPIVVVGAQLGGIVLAILWIHSLSGELAIAGSVCYVAVLAIALSTNVRINKQIARWSVQSPPDDWACIRAVWIRFHIVRTLFLLPGLACYILACLVSR